MRWLRGERVGPVAFLAGLPRAGTTLAVNLLNKLPGVVALDEPMGADRVSGVTSADPDEVIRAVRRFCAKTRRGLLEEGHATTKRPDAATPTNHYAESATPGGPRRPVSTPVQLEVAAKLPRDFLLVVKHPVLFTALLPRLCDVGPVFGLVRDPIAVLGSWNSVDITLRLGRAPAAERIDLALFRRLARMEDLHDRQAEVLEWHFAALAAHLPRERILAYEQVVATGGRALAVVAPGAASLAEPLASRNKNPLYDAATLARAGEALLRRGKAVFEFYPRAAVEESVAALRTGKPAG